MVYPTRISFVIEKGNRVEIEPIPGVSSEIESQLKYISRRTGKFIEGLLRELEGAKS